MEKSREAFFHVAGGIQLIFGIEKSEGIERVTRVHSKYLDRRMLSPRFTVPLGHSAPLPYTLSNSIDTPDRVCLISGWVDFSSNLMPREAPEF